MSCAGNPAGSNTVDYLLSVVVEVVVEMELVVQWTGWWWRWSWWFRESRCCFRLLYCSHFRWLSSLPSRVVTGYPITVGGGGTGSSIQVMMVVELLQLFLNNSSWRWWRSHNDGPIQVPCAGCNGGSGGGGGGGYQVKIQEVQVIHLQ